MLYFIIGTFVGSFLNVCIYRLPRGESVAFPPSHCPECGRKIGFADLIPILSYFLLRGRCRYCKKKITLRYPAVELLTGAAFALVAAFFPLSVDPLAFFFYLAMLSVLIVIFFTDQEKMVIPDSLNILLAGLGLTYHALKWDAGLLFSSLLAGLAAGLAMLLVAKLGKLVFKKEAMGEGDIFLAAALGLCLGTLVLPAILIAYFIAGAISLVLLSFRRVKIGQELPFGGALALSAMIVVFFGERIVAWYMGAI